MFKFLIKCNIILILQNLLKLWWFSTLINITFSNKPHYALFNIFIKKTLTNIHEHKYTLISNQKLILFFKLLFSFLEWLNLFRSWKGIWYLEWELLSLLIKKYIYICCYNSTNLVHKFDYNFWKIILRLKMWSTFDNHLQVFW